MFAKSGEPPPLVLPIRLAGDVQTSLDGPDDIGELILGVVARGGDSTPSAGSLAVELVSSRKPSSTDSAGVELLVAVG
jgi:hypothetical protein